MTRLFPFVVLASGAYMLALWFSESAGGKALSFSDTAEQHPASEIHVIDGDTVSISGDRYRLLGFDTPETFRAQCQSEIALGLRAKLRLEKLISESGGLELHVRHRPDKFGRKLATAFSNGTDVADIMVSEGLARPYSGGKRHSWCRKEAA